MARHPKGVTLTAQERSLAGYDGSKAVKTHSVTITLPNGVSCPVQYERQSSRCHEFEFGAPLNRHRWIYEGITGGIPAIEAKARELAAQEFQQALEQEQKAMRRKGSPTGRNAGRMDTGPEIEAKVADKLGGTYAVCGKSKSGRLVRIGGVYDKPDGALKEIESGVHANVRLHNGQKLVVGICNRSTQRWEEPAFLPMTDPAAVQADSNPTAVAPDTDSADDLEAEDDEFYLERHADAETLQDWDEEGDEDEQ